MSRPGRANVHVNRPLTNISIAYIQAAGRFIADQVFSILPVSKQSDRYFSYSKDDWFRDEAKERAPGTESAGGGYDIDSTPNYFCPVYAFHKDVSDQLRDNQDQPLDLDRDATMFASQKMLIRKEKAFVDKHFKAGVWSADFTPGTLWSAAGSDPVNDVGKQMDIIDLNTGFAPNTLVVTPTVHRELMDNASILDRIKHTQKGSVTPDMLAGLFGVERYLIAKASSNTGPDKKDDSVSMARIFTGDNCLLTYSERSPGILKPSAGYTFSWTPAGGVGGTAVSRFRMEKLKSDRIEVESAFDQKLVANDLGIFFDSVL